jgi:hypothetical protein
MAGFLSALRRSFSRKNFLSNKYEGVSINDVGKIFLITEDKIQSGCESKPETDIPRARKAQRLKNQA